MSDAVFSHLPRFDVVSERRPADWLRALSVAEPASPAGTPHAEIKAEPAEGPVQGPAPMPKAEPATVRPIPQETVALQATVANLARLMERLERESRQQTVETVQAISAQLFPELSRRVLAEEIGRHLPGLIPASVPKVDIRAEPVLAGQLAEMIARHPSLEGRCEVIAQEGQGEGRAEVSWRTGGVTFDFDGLLSACLADLGIPNKTTTTEHT